MHQRRSGDGQLRSLRGRRSPSSMPQRLARRSSTWKQRSPAARREKRSRAGRSPRSRQRTPFSASGLASGRGCPNPRLDAPRRRKCLVPRRPDRRARGGGLSPIPPSSRHILEHATPIVPRPCRRRRRRRRSTGGPAGHAPPHALGVPRCPARRGVRLEPGRWCTSAGTARSGSGAPASWRSTSGSTPGTHRLFILLLVLPQTV